MYGFKISNLNVVSLNVGQLFVNLFEQRLKYRESGANSTYNLYRLKIFKESSLKNVVAMVTIMTVCILGI